MILQKIQREPGAISAKDTLKYLSSQCNDVRKSQFSKTSLKMFVNDNDRLNRWITKFQRGQIINQISLSCNLNISPLLWSWLLYFSFVRAKKKRCFYSVCLNTNSLTLYICIVCDQIPLAVVGNRSDLTPGAHHCSSPAIPLLLPAELRRRDSTELPPAGQGTATKPHSYTPAGISCICPPPAARLSTSTFFKGRANTWGIYYHPISSRLLPIQSPSIITCC